jgi:peptide/nickel transport system permease protein
MTVTAGPVLGDGEFELGDEHQEEPGMSILRRLATMHRGALVGIAIIVVMVLFCWVGPLVYVTNQLNGQKALLFGVQNASPSLRHLFGTDDNGFDELGRLMFAGRNSLEVAAAAAAVGTIIGVVWGAVAGFYGGIVDSVMMRFVDAALSVPALLLLIVLAVVFKPSILLLILVIGGVSWLVPARLIRGEALTLRTREFVEAVRVAGGRDRRMIARHIIPNAVGVIVVNATFQVADAMLFLAALGYLGLGVPSPQTDWGSMLAKAVTVAAPNGYWWEIVGPGACIVLVVLAFNSLGDALREILETRIRSR